MSDFSHNPALLTNLTTSEVIGKAYVQNLIHRIIHCGFPSDYRGVYSQ